MAVQSHPTHMKCCLTHSSVSLGEKGFPPTGAPGQEHDIQGGVASLHVEPFYVALHL